MARPVTEGQKRLCEWLEADKTRSQSALARVLDVKSQTVCGWANGKMAPDESIWELLEAATGIAGELFLTEEERKKRADRQARAAVLREARVAEDGRASAPSDPG